MTLGSKKFGFAVATMRVNFTVMRHWKNYRHFVAMHLPKFCQIGVGRKRIGSSLFSTINQAEIRLFINLSVGIAESTNMELILLNVQR